MRPVVTVLAALALLMPADASTATKSGLWGYVRRGPITPVCMVNKPCDEPAAHVALVFTRNGRETARVTTRADGFYRVALAPGAYGVRTLQKISIGRGLEPAKVLVQRGRRVRVDLHLDTGIR